MTITQERIFLDGSRGRLSGELAYPDSSPKAAVLIVGPHPYMGGHMENNVVAALANALASADCAALRFDYAGVGESDGGPVDVAESLDAFWSTGRAPEDPLMVEDARAAMAWLTSQTGDRPLFIVGYSFGAWAAAQVVMDDMAGLILLSPTLEKHDFSRIEPLSHRLPMLIVHSENDFATSIERYERWRAHEARRAESIRVDGADHFHIGREDELARSCIAFIERRLIDLGETST